MSSINPYMSVSRDMQAVASRFLEAEDTPKGTLGRVKDAVTSFFYAAKHVAYTKAVIPVRARIKGHLVGEIFARVIQPTYNAGKPAERNAYLRLANSPASSEIYKPLSKELAKAAFHDHDMTLMGNTAVSFEPLDMGKCVGSSLLYCQKFHETGGDIQSYAADFENGMPFLACLYQDGSNRINEASHRMRLLANTETCNVLAYWDAVGSLGGLEASCNDHLLHNVDSATLLRVLAEKPLEENSTYLLDIPVHILGREVGGHVVALSVNENGETHLFDPNIGIGELWDIGALLQFYGSEGVEHGIGFVKMVPLVDGEDSD